MYRIKYGASKTKVTVIGSEIDTIYFQDVTPWIMDNEVVNLVEVPDLGNFHLMPKLDTIIRIVLVQEGMVVPVVLLVIQINVVVVTVQILHLLHQLEQSMRQEVLGDKDILIICWYQVVLKVV